MSDMEQLALELGPEEKSSSMSSGQMGKSYRHPKRPAPAIYRVGILCPRCRQARDFKFAGYRGDKQMWTGMECGHEIVEKIWN